MKISNRRGNAGLDSVPSIAISFVIIAVVFVVGYLVLAGLTANTTNADALTAVGNLTDGMNNIVSFAPTWGTVIAAAVVLLIVIGGLYFFRGREGM